MRPCTRHEYCTVPYHIAIWDRISVTMVERYSSPLVETQESRTRSPVPYVDFRSRELQRLALIGRECTEGGQLFPYPPHKHSVLNTRVNVWCSTAKRQTLARGGTESTVPPLYIHHRPPYTGPMIPFRALSAVGYRHNPHRNCDCYGIIPSWAQTILSTIHKLSGRERPSSRAA